MRDERRERESGTKRDREREIFIERDLETEKYKVTAKHGLRERER